MKKIILGFISVAIFSCSSDKEAVNSSNSNKLIQAISTNLDTNLVTTINYNYSDSNNMLEKVQVLNLQENLNLIQEYMYDGDVVKGLISTLSSGETSTITYSYTDNLITSFTDVEGGDTYSDYCEYNDLGQLLTIKEFNSGNELINVHSYQYDNNGNIKKFDLVAGDNIIASRNYNSYDNKKSSIYYQLPEAITKVMGFSKNNVLAEDNYNYEYTYNNAGYPTQVIKKLDGVIKTKTVYKYQ